MAKDYKCSLCGGVFETTVSDEEAMAESRAIFGDVPPEQLDVVCDDCWHKINPADNQELVRETKAHYAEGRDHA